MAHRTPRQRETAHRIERLIGVVAPALDLLLFAGDRLARVAGRNQVDPEPPRRLGGRGERTPLGGPPGASGRRD